MQDISRRLCDGVDVHLEFLDGLCNFILYLKIQATKTPVNII